MLKISTIRPGILVSLKTSIAGNVSYSKTEIEAPHLIDNGALRAVTETARTVQDPTEYERAVKIRGKARSIISGICAQSNFGLLCPESSAGQLEARLEAAQQLIREFNSAATQTKISLYAVNGRVAQDDAQAVRGINSEIRDLMETMESGLCKLDVQAVRDAANRARALGAMLSDDAAAKTKPAIEAARAAARQIVKAGEGLATEIDAQTLRVLRTARTAFLDLDEGGSEQDVSTPADTSARAIEMDDMAQAYSEPTITLAASAQFPQSALEF